MSTTSLSFETVKKSVLKNAIRHSISSKSYDESEDIEFVEASKPDNYNEEIKRRYIPINSTIKKQSHQESVEKSKNLKPTIPEPIEENKIPEPKAFIHNKNIFNYNWTLPRNNGPGFVNLGNTCFLNSVIQILSYTPPLWEYLNSNSHQNDCKSSGFCSICQLSNLFKQMSKNSTPISPTPILRNIKLIANYFRPGRQEDAHEFLRAYIESMQKHIQYGYKSFDRVSLETTFINHIFGGWFRSTVECMQCNHKSVTFDPLLEINLDIAKCDSLVAALNLYCKTEILSGSKYLCRNCHKKVDAKKTVLIEKHPKVFTIQLKRFNFSKFFNSKVVKYVAFPELLNLGPYVYNPHRQITYSLYGVVVHRGNSCSSGHYYAYAKTSAGLWCELNDQSSKCVPISQVLLDEAYLLFYIENSIKTSKSENNVTHVNNNTNNNKLNELTNSLSKFTSFESKTTSFNNSTKTKENPLIKNNKELDINKTHDIVVPIAYWNQNNRAIVIPKSESANLYKTIYNQSLLSVGRDVQTWEDTPNKIDQQIVPHKPKLTHFIDAEMDAGRKRKLKRKSSISTYSHLFRQNPFQSMHDQITTSKHRLNKYKKAKSLKV